MTRKHIPDPADLAGLIAFTKGTAAAEDVSLPDAIAGYIVGRVWPNVELLEGTIIRLVAYASLTNQKITHDLARETLDDILDDHGKAAH
jgi:chromosomal replication initiator protein